MTFEFHAEGEATEFICSLDSGLAQRCTSPREVDVTDGPHTFQVTASNRGTPDETPASFAWAVDTIAPDSQITDGPPSFDNSTTVDITFTGSPVTDIARFECSLDNAAFATCTSPVSLTGLVSGLHGFQVRAVDAAGNSDPSPSIRSWTLDTSTPDTMITAGPATGSTSNNTSSFSFTSPEAASVFECSFDAGAFAGCSSPVTFNNLASGSHTFTVRAKNVTTNVVDPTPASRTWTVDATPPVLTIDSTPMSPTNDSTPTFAFSSTATDIAGYECQIDGIVTFEPCTSPYTGPTVADGTRIFRVRATDNVGNQTSASHTWLIDTVAPTVSITSGPSGTIGTSSGTFTFTTGGLPTLVDCSLDGSAFTACTSPRAFNGLMDGSHTFVVRVTDAAGNSNLAMRMFDVLTVGPTVSITGGPTGLINNGSPMFTFMTTNAATIDCRMDGGSFAPCTSPYSASNLSQGMHTFQVRVRDVAMNTATDSRAFSVDTIAPTVTILAGPSGPINDTSPTFTFLVGGSPITTECRFDANAFAACTSPYTASPDLSAGAHTVEIRVTDAAGNTGFDTRSFQVITVGPTVTITSGPTGATSDNTPSWTFTTAGSPAVVECSLDSSQFAACTSPFDAPLVSDGGHTFVVRVSDAAMNINTDSRSIIVDTLVPTVTINVGPSGPSNDPTPSFGFVANGATTVTCRIVSDSFVPCTSPFTAAPLADGPHVFEVIASDDAGNASVDSRSFSIDTVGPDVVITTGPTGTTADNTPTFDFTISGSTFVSSECAIDSGIYSPCTSPYTTSPLGGGMHTVHVRAIDDAGNQDIDDRTFTVESTAPSVTVTIGPNGNCATPPAGGGGPAPTCNPTNDSTPTFTFEAQPGWSTLLCRFDGNPFVDCHGSIAPGVFGTASFTDNASPLGNGGHFFEVQACNASMNCSSDVKPFSVDTAVPLVFFTGGPIDSMSGPATPTNAATQVFTFGSAGTPVSPFECRVNVGATLGSFASCNSTTMHSTTRTDGQYTLEIRVHDLAFNFATVTRNFTVDRTAPVINVTAQPPSSTKSPAPNFVFSTNPAQEPHPGVFQCNVDGAGFSNCVSPFTPPNTEGAHTFQIQMTDLAGNLGQTSVFNYFVDNTAPTVAIAGPTITNNQQPTYNVQVVNAGNGPGPITVVCMFNAVPGSCSIPVGADFLAPGGVNVTPTGPLPDLGVGMLHTITVTATDVAVSGGNQGSASRMFTIDLVAPTVTGAIATDPPLISPASPSQTIPSVSFVARDDRAPTFPLQSVQCRVDSQAFAPCTSPFTGTGIGDGNHVYQIAVIDAAGNPYTESVPFVVDDTDPVVAFVSGPGPSPSNPTNNTSASFVFSVANPGTNPSIINSVVCTFTGPTAVPCVIDTTPPYADPLMANAMPMSGSTFANGSYTVRVTATDLAGNSHFVDRTFLVDTIAPTIAISSPVMNTHYGANPVFTYSITETGSGVDTRMCSIDGGAATSCSTSFTPADSLADGVRTYGVVVTDLAGNVSNAGLPTSVSFTLDTAAPVLAVTGGPSPAQVFGTPNSVPTFNISLMDLTDGTVSCTINSGTVTGFGAPHAYTAPSDTDSCTLPANLAEGSYTVAISATDALGHTTTPGFSVNFSVDTTPPTLTTPSRTTPLNDNTPTFTFTAGADATGSAEYAIDGGMVWVSCSSLASCTTTMLSDGPHTVTVRVHDAVNNFASQTSASFTIDTTGPTISGLVSPSFPTGDNTPTFSFNAGDATTAMYRIGTSGPFTGSCSVSAGTATCTTSALTPDGSFTIDFQAYDALTNPSAVLSSGAFTVDTTGPVISALSAVVTPSTNTTPMVSFTADASATSAKYRIGGSGPFNGTCASATLCTVSALAEGTHTIQVQAYDSLGNPSNTLVSNSFVVDTSSPAFTVSTPALSTDTTPTITVTFTTPELTTTTAEYQIDGAGAFTACTNTTTCTTTALSEGSHTVTVRVTDGVNHQTSVATGSFVVDTSSPVVAITPPAAFTNDTTPSFAYTVTDASSTTVTCTLTPTAPAGASINVPCTSGSSPITAPTLAYGAYSLLISATDTLGHAAGTDTETFTVVDTSLSALVVKDGATTLTLSPVFSASTLSYTVNVPSSLADVTITATTVDGANTLTIDGGAASSGVESGDLTLAAGPDVIPVTVQRGGPSGPTTTYLVNFNRTLFAAHATFAGVNPYDVAIGDLNGDAKPDLAVANYSSSSVSVLLSTTASGASTPTFATKVDFATQSNALEVVMGDLNGDGLLDLVATNPNSGSTSIFLNTTAMNAATPTFATRIDVTTGSTSRAVALGDVNADGKLDLAVTSYDTNKVSVLLNTTASGVLAFAPAVALDTGTNPYAVAFGDFNTDGKIDLAVANFNSSNISVLLSTTAAAASTASFSPKVDFATGHGLVSIAAGDFNADGRPDLVAAGVYSQTVSVLLNTATSGAATPSFSSVVDFATGTTSRSGSVSVGDLDGDGKLDVAVANFDSPSVTVLRGLTAAAATTPSFAAKVDFATGTVPLAVSIGDFNQDARLDLAVANAGTANVSVLLGH